MIDAAHQFDWIAYHLPQLETSYSNLSHLEAQNLPFVLYCIAMYYKHQTIQI